MLVLLATVLSVGLAVRLGLWQLDRAAQKEALQSAQQSRSMLPRLDASSLARSAQEAVPQHHRTVRLQGEWIAEHTVYLDNRQMKGRPGFFVVTPLRLGGGGGGGGDAVLVQRGWVPRDMQDRTRLPPVTTPAGTVELSGRIAPPPSRLYEFAGQEAGPIRQNLDIAEFGRAAALNLRPLSVLQTDSGDSGDSANTASDGLLRDWPLPAADVHKHYGYAFQWFALGALMTGLYVWFQLVRPRLRARSATVA
ncbi:MAG: transmembrane cytochrome oxidase [Methylibium sp. NZG]|nr:MAG: transmembrane cytochrome oxidase [Methylibium sp. NZG]